MKALLEKLYSVVQYNPTNQKDIRWDIHCTLHPDYITGDEPESDGEKELAVYDVKHHQWLVLDREYITSTSFPEFVNYCDTTTIELSGMKEKYWYGTEGSVDRYDVIDDTWVSEDPVVSPAEWALKHNCDHDGVDYKGYTDNYFVNETSQYKKNSKNPWIHNFVANKLSTEVLDILQITAHDLYFRSSDNISACRERWLEKIIEYKEIAHNTLEQELTDDLDSDTADEINIIKQLLEKIPSEIEPVLDGCESIVELLDMWPLLLLPAPDFASSDKLAMNGKALEIYDDQILT